MRFTHFCLTTFVCLIVDLSYAQEQPAFTSATISGLGARNIGSAAMSGHISAIAGTREPSGKITLFVGAASGGVWKSDDGGTRYRPVFDEQGVQSIGAIAIDPANPKNVWVGAGESWTRNSVSIGDGIYKSTDGGETWNHVGLERSERIARITVTPGKSDAVFAAVPGALWSDSSDRGLYKTSDSGKTWKQVLKGTNLSTGCTDVAIDPAKTDRTNLLPADCFVQTTAARPGQKLLLRPIKAFRKSHTAGSRLRSRLPARNGSIAWLNRRTARCSFPMMAARPGTSETKAIGWFGVRSISRG